MTGDPIDRTLVQPAAEQARDDQSHRLLYIAGALVIVGVAGLAVWAWLSIQSLHTDVTEARGAADTATSSAQQLYDQVKRLGGTPVVPAPAAGPAGPQGPGPTQAQIDAAVAVQLAEHPPPAGQNATPAMVASAVADFLTVHPPQPGRPPTAEEIASAASAYIAEHAADFRGQNGQNATDAQVATAVAAYCDAHGSCAGPPGQPGHEGAPGVSVTRQYFDRNSSGQCRNYNDFSDGRTKVDQGPAGDSACAPAPPPTTTPSAVLPTGTTLRRRD